MNLMIDRKLIVEAVVLLAVCVGGWMMIVDPNIKKLNELEAKIDEAKSNPLLSSAAIVERLAGQQDAVRRRVMEVVRQNELGTDTSRLYGVIMDLGKQHDVVVHSINPASLGGGGESAAAVRRGSYSMRLEGRYENVASFLAGIERLDGFIRPGPLALTPRGEEGSGTVQATFTFETLQFTLPEALTKLEEPRDADG